MLQNRDDDADHGELRRRAEERLRLTGDAISRMSTNDVKSLVYDLQVHQLELEITTEDLKDTQLQLTKATNKYRDLYDSAPVGYLILDENGMIHNANLTAADLLGVPVAELKKRMFPLLVSKEERDHCYLYLHDVFKSHLPKTADIRFHKTSPNGEVFLRLHTVRWESDEGKAEWRMALIDVTEEKRAVEALQSSEQRYRFLFDEIGVLNLILDMKGTILDVNQQGLHDLGYNKSEIIGQPFLNLIIAEQRIEMEVRLRHTIGYGDEHEPMDIAITAKDGTIQTYMIAPRSEKIVENGTHTSILISASNVTERIRLERELQRRAGELAATNAELESFSYSVAHDLRNPLNVIKLITDALIEDCSFQTDDKCKDYLSGIKSGIVRASSVIDDLLALSKITRQEMILTDINLSGMARLAINELAAANPERIVQVTIQDGLKGLADARLISVALGNLLNNAWKYTAKVEHACIEFGELEKGTQRIYYVKDNGAGFDMKHARKLFQPFNRLHSEKEFPGSGVGLAIVKRAIMRHGGEVWAESEKGNGATFYFTLPDDSRSG